MKCNDCNYFRVADYLASGKRLFCGVDEYSSTIRYVEGREVPDEIDPPRWCPVIAARVLLMRSGQEKADEH